MARVQDDGCRAKATWLFPENEEKNWSSINVFEVLPKRQFMIKFLDSNILEDQHLWLTIKTSPAILLEPSFVDRRPLVGVAGAVSRSGFYGGEGVGADNIARFLGF